MERACPVNATYLVYLHSLSDSLFGFDMCDIKPAHHRLFEPTVIVIKSKHMVWPEKKVHKGTVIIVNHSKTREDINIIGERERKETPACTNRNVGFVS